MQNLQLLTLGTVLAPAAMLAVVFFVMSLKKSATTILWPLFNVFSLCGVAFIALALAVSAGVGSLHWPGIVSAPPLTLVLALLVQLLGTVIGSFSARYLEGEKGQRRYIASLAAVLTFVHLLLMADHWLIVIAAWALVGIALQNLLCFYQERPFALLAAHKKQIADRVADALLLGGAALAWSEVGSGSLSALSLHTAQNTLSPALQGSAVLLVLGVILRTALLPVHGWLIQVMEAPTPVSALLHAGVVNLGGFVLIRFAPLLEQATLARALLLVFGLGTAVLAGMVMLTRVTIKVRLAWSTVAQMGFMVLECALGLYTLAALHLIGHSLYKAHAFLSASSAVRQTRLKVLHTTSTPSAWSLFLAPVISTAVVLLVAAAASKSAWPWWWSGVLGLAWAPLLWLPVRPSQGALSLSGLLMVFGLTVTAVVVHAIPFGVQDTPHEVLGVIAAAGMVALYICQALLQYRPQLLSSWRRWSYGGFYVDEAYTRLALKVWPTQWSPDTSSDVEFRAALPLPVETAR